MRKAPAGLLAQVPAEHGFSAAEVILSAGMFMASGRLTRDSERARKPACRGLVLRTPLRRGSALPHEPIVAIPSICHRLKLPRYGALGSLNSVVFGCQPAADC